MKKIQLIIIPFLLFALNACSQSEAHSKAGSSEDIKTYPGAKPASYWKKVLTPQAYQILVERGTEPPFQNPYWNNHKKGIYVSAATGTPLFSSEATFESGTGWPSFFKSIDLKAIEIVTDNSAGMVRDEVVEASTGLHLGHVFNDGPAPAGKR